MSPHAGASTGRPMNALEVLQEIIRRQGLESDVMKLVSHRAGPPWRPACSNECQRLATHEAGSASTRPEGAAVTGEALLSMTLADLDHHRSRPDDVVSISSRVDGAAGVRHLALMDLSLRWFVRLPRLRDQPAGDRLPVVDQREVR